MVPTNLVGGGRNNNGDKFEIDEKEHLLKKCPSGHKPINSKFKEGSYRAHFDKKHCSNCPLRKDCSVVKQKKSYLFKVSEKTLHRCQLITSVVRPTLLYIWRSLPKCATLECSRRKSLDSGCDFPGNLG